MFFVCFRITFNFIQLFYWLVNLIRMYMYMLTAHLVMFQLIFDRITVVCVFICQMF